MSKQDRQGARNVSEFVRRYNFDKTFAEILGIANDAQDTALKAAEAVKTFDQSLTADQIFNLLTNGGEDQGIYRENGNIYLNANFIKTGFISSDLIKAGVIRSLDYETIDVEEYYPSEALYPYVSLYPNDGKDITKGMEIDFAAGVIRVGGGEVFEPINVYPVGSIYISTLPTSPAELFGGSWERLKDRFLLSAGDTYKAGSTGGAATHQLSVNEMPSHRHDFEYSTDNGATYTKMTGAGKDGTLSNEKYVGISNSVTQFASYRFRIASAGSTAAHNNMPPYAVVYVWERIE